MAKNVIEEYLTKNKYESVAPLKFYRSIFPENSLQKRNERKDRTYNAIAVEIIKKKDSSRPDIVKHIIHDDLLDIKTLLKSENFVIMDGISYIGKSRKSIFARNIYSLIIDLDGVNRYSQVEDLFYQFDGLGKSNLIPLPTYVVSSGNGLHLYYVFKEPLNCFPEVMKSLALLKNELTRKIWNGYVTDLAHKPQYQPVSQGFRLVGGKTKKGKITKAFAVGKKIDTEYLNKFVKDEYKFKIKDPKNKISLDLAKELYPEWYERKVNKPNKDRRHWKNHKALYLWWKQKICDEITEGHRFYGIMCLAIYAKKCGIEREVLEDDAYELLSIMDRKTIHKENHFTMEDIYAALEAYDDNYITFPIKTISRLTNIRIDPNKRNGLKRAVHLKIARFSQEVKNPNWRKGNGRKSKKEEVIQFRREFPLKTKKECIDELKISKKTVYKYWTEYDLEELQKKELNNIQK